MKNSTKILVVLILIVMAVSFTSSVFSRDKGRVINEAVKFGEYHADYKAPFVVNEQKKLILDVEAKLESGEFTLWIISPDNESVYEKKGNSFKQHVILDVRKGTWYYRIKCSGGNNGDKLIAAKNGSYTIQGTLE